MFMVLTTFPQNFYSDRINLPFKLFFHCDPIAKWLICSRRTKKLVRRVISRYDQYLLRLESLKKMKRHNPISFDHDAW